MADSLILCSLSMIAVGVGSCIDRDRPQTMAADGMTGGKGG